MNKKIMEVALNRLDQVITEMDMSPSTVTRMGFSGVAHDLVKIVKMAADMEVIDEEEETL